MTDNKLKPFIIKKPALSDNEKIIAKFESELDHAIKLEEMRAKIVRARYLQLLKQGFTEQQALELVKDF